MDEINNKEGFVTLASQERTVITWMKQNYIG